jgi:hypothetical protein
MGPFRGGGLCGGSRGIRRGGGKTEAQQAQEEAA